MRETSTSPIGRMSSTKSSILRGAPVSSKMKLSMVASITFARKASARRIASTRFSTLALDLDHRQFPLDRAHGQGQVVHRVNGNQPLELVADLLNNLRCTGGDNGDARKMGLVRNLRDGQTFDFVPASREHADDAGEHARLIVDQNR